MSDPAGGGDGLPAAGVPASGVLTGGFSEQELRGAGAVEVFERLADLRADLGVTPLSAV